MTTDPMPADLPDRIIERLHAECTGPNQGCDDCRRDFSGITRNPACNECTRPSETRDA